MDLVFPRQLFINGQFVESVSGDTMPTVNPTTEEVGPWSCVKQCFSATGANCFHVALRKGRSGAFLFSFYGLWLVM